MSGPNLAMSAMAIPASDSARTTARTVWLLLEMDLRFRPNHDNAVSGKEMYATPIIDVIKSPERTAANSECGGSRLNGVAPIRSIVINGKRTTLIVCCSVG